MKLLGVNSYKTQKGEKHGYLTGILYLAPSDLSGVANVCAYASKGCRAACLFTAGRGGMNVVRNARINKTKRFKYDHKQFMADLISDITALERKAERENLIPVVRLNGTSDITWENVKVDGYNNIMERFPHIQFYDYTKNPFRGPFPSNYHVTFSLAEDNDAHAEHALKNGINVAAVFDTPREAELPLKYMGHLVIDGDETDLRFNDPKGVIVGLRAKGKARKDTSGFVRMVEQ